jgi:hypothetical protein
MHSHVGRGGRWQSGTHRGYHLTISITNWHCNATDTDYKLFNITGVPVATDEIKLACHRIATGHRVGGEGAVWRLS